MTKNVVTGGVDTVIGWWRRRKQAKDMEALPALFDLCRDAALQLDEAGHITYANPAMATLLEVASSDDLLQRALRDFCIPTTLQQLIRPGTGAGYGEMRTANGRPRFVSYSLTPCTLQPGHQMLLVRDETAAMTGQQTLIANEKRFRLLTEQAKDIISEHTLEGRIEYISPACREVLGYQPTELVGKMPHDLVHADDLDLVLQALKDLTRYAEGVTLQCRVLRYDGHYIWTEIYGKLIADAPRDGGVFVLVIRDITNRRMAEESLRESERLRSLFDLARDEFFLVDNSGRIVDVNQHACEHMGTNRGWLIGHQFDQLISAPDIDLTPFGLEDIYRRACRGEQVMLDVIRINHAGESLQAEALFSAIRHEGRNLLLVSLRDVSQRKRMEAEFRESVSALRLLHMRLFGIIEGTNDLIAALDRECRLIAYNTAFKQAFEYNYGLPVALGTNLLVSLVDQPEAMARTFTNWHRALTGDVFADTQVWKCVEKGDEYYEVNYCPIRDEVGEVCGAAYIGRNVTQRKVAEDSLKRALEQLEAARRETEKANLQLRQANTELLRQANQDGMTGIANRRYFDDYLAHEWRRAARLQESMAMIFADVDFFKNYNDHYGHQAGDECLRKIANALQDQLHRPGDLLARYGGEEFVILLPNTTLAGGIFIAEGMLKAVSTLKIPHAASSAADHVTLSLGVAATVPSEATAEGFLMYGADQALYSAKKSGRNRVFGSPI
ncbi:diguanylate cyclase [Chitinivorax sp. B]|uniref:diguanylate cyclase domain-containing protein n=1 Tax=Chitinivorax sp. B TaxID=2502235 RepID=UPI0010F83084|nr:diguanylate cyclase [Chitinivorax sp. B]